MFSRKSRDTGPQTLLSGPGLPYHLPQRPFPSSRITGASLSCQDARNSLVDASRGHPRLPSCDFPGARDTAWSLVPVAAPLLGSQDLHCAALPPTEGWSSAFPTQTQGHDLGQIHRPTLADTIYSLCSAFYQTSPLECAGVQEGADCSSPMGKATAPRILGVFPGSSLPTAFQSKPPANTANATYSVTQTPASLPLQLRPHPGTRQHHPAQPYRLPYLHPRARLGLLGLFKFKDRHLPPGGSCSRPGQGCRLRFCGFFRCAIPEWKVQLICENDVISHFLPLRICHCCST